MIPDAAVEASARQMSVNDGDLVGWILYQSDAQKVLEAAAPHMLAEAWERGNRAALGRPNPYRSQA